MAELSGRELAASHHIGGDEYSAVLLEAITDKYDTPKEEQE